ncbi:MAG: HD-GYP domain-containing protein [Candidatus Methylomirabilales bacterium]|jgi:putative nucleotidyltransferase with HDIG domain|nr:HD domain-containing protein [candidate division NC10 bacterium]
MNLEPKVAEQFFLSLNAAWKNLGLYSPTHPAATAAFKNLSNAFEKMLGDRERITFGLLRGMLLLNGVPLTSKPDLFRALVTRLQNSEIQGVTLLKGCTLEELRHFAEVLGQNVKGVEVEQELKRREVTHILLVKLVQEGTGEERQTEAVDERVGTGAIYSRALQTIRKVFQETRLGKVPSLGEVQRTVEDLVGSILKGKHSLMALTMIKSYDEYLFNHSVNVGILSMTLGESLGLDVTALRELGLGALLHDVGKINIPETIIRAPRKLTEEEWEIVKRHPEDGVKILEKMGVQTEIALRVTKEHHIDFDGRGYPRLGPEDQPHAYSMVVHVADTYDAMTTVRPYQGPADPNQAISRMKKLAGTAFNPLTLDTFVDMLGIYPPGTAVRLTSAEIAVVTRPGTEDTSRPWVRIVQDQEGKAVDGDEISLMEWDSEGEDYARSIVIAFDPVIRRIDVPAVLQGKDLTPVG